MPTADTGALLVIGKTLSHYRILNKLGAGGMGEVYRAHDEKLDRPVALKLLLNRGSQDDSGRAQLLREARAAAALNHPNICTVHEVGEAEEQPYIAMELVEGKTLSAQLEVGPLPVDRVLHYGQQLADALSHAHERGVLHRDFKSANVIITRQGRAKVLDFGLAARVSGKKLTEATTQSHVSQAEPAALVGTLAYMAPEQLRGQPADTRSDVWSLGVVLHEMAAGSLPFQGRTVFELSSAIINRSPGPLPPTVPAGMRAVIARCLAKEPEQRYQRGGEVRAALEALQTGEIHVGVPAATSASPWLWHIATAVVVVGVLVASYLLVRSRPAQEPAGPLVIKPLTSFVGMEWGASLSPDASFLAYAHNRFGPMDIFVLPTGGGDAVRLTDNPADDLTPRWSPDGRYIAFLSDRGAGTNVYLIPPLGGAERKLAETGIPWLEGAADTLFALGATPWSPDGSELLYSRQHATGEIAIWKVNVSTGAETQLTHPPPDAADSYASWSFDGKRIAFSRNDGGKYALWLLDAQSGKEELLLKDQYRNMTPAWTADNRRLVFSSSRSGAANLWEIDVESRQLRQVTSGAGADIMPVVSAAGRLAYTTYGHQVDLYWGPVDQPQEKHQRLTSQTHNNFGGRVSPDGRQIVYQSDRTGNYELWLLDRSSGTERDLTNNPAWDAMADWSPDGREMVFLSNRAGSLQVWVMKLESGQVRRISERSRSIPFEPHFSGPRWSPDGKAIGFIAGGKQKESLWVTDPQGRNERAALSGVIGFDWYRDHRHIIYTRRDAEGVVEMRAADLETGKEAVLLRGPTAELVVARDGRGVAFLHSASHFNMQLQVLRLAPPASPEGLPRPVGEPRQLTHGGATWHVHNGGWSPDGKAIVYTRDADSGDIYAIQNFH
jgi:Tol biopolymer transport system component